MEATPTRDRTGRRRFAPRRARRTVAATAVLLLALAGCGTPEAPVSQAPPVEEDAPPAAEPWVQQGGPLVVGRSTNNIADIAVRIAVEEGWFEQAGLEVEVVEAATLTDLVPLLVSGQLSAMFMGVTPTLFAAFEEGVPLRIPATVLVNGPDVCSATGMLVDPEVWASLDPQDPTTIRGLRVGGNFTSLTSARYLDALAAKWGITVDDLELVQLTADTHIAALQDDQVDAVFTFEPILTVGPAQTEFIAVEPGTELLDGDVTGVLVVGERLLEDRELAARYLAVYLRAMERINEGATPDNVALISASTGIEPEIVERMCLQPQSPDGRPNEQRLAEIWEYAVARGEAQQVLPSGEVWDHELLERAQELLDSGEIVLSD